MDPYLGEIRLFAGNYAPQNWAFCNGAILPISQHTALFSLLGVNYGGNGQSNFALPDLRGRVPVGQGQGPGLSYYQIGESEGTEEVSLNSTTMGAHSHTINVVGGDGDQTTPGSHLPAQFPSLHGKGTNAFAPANTKLALMSSLAMVNSTGGSQPHPNLQPSVALNYIICMAGFYPPHQ